MPKSKVILLSKKYPPQKCGVADYTIQLSKHLTADADVCILTEKDTSQADNVIATNFVWSFKNTYRLYTYIKKTKADTVVLQYVPYLFNKRGIAFWLIGLFVLLNLSGIKCITHFHELAVRFRISHPKQLVFSFLQYTIAFFLGVLSTGCITSIDYYYIRIKRFNANTKQAAIPSNISMLETSAQMEERIVEIKNKHPFIMLCFGNHNHQFLIEACALLKKEGYAFYLILMGAINDRDLKQIKSLIAEHALQQHVLCTGFVSEWDVNCYFKSADLYVQVESLTNKGEGGLCAKSGSLATAYQFGLPVMGTKGDITESFFKDEENVFFIYNYTPAAIAERLKAIISNPEIRHQVAARAQDVYKNHMSWNHTIRCYEELLSSQ
jgi:glycosyltransferase involved in cell wall biosynthesis